MASEQSFVAQIALSAALDEISNAEGQITTYVQNRGLVRDGTTRKALLFVLYQTGKHGPQNGYRLVLVEEGAKASNVESLLQNEGPLLVSTREMVRIQGTLISVTR